MDNIEEWNALSHEGKQTVYWKWRAEHYRAEALHAWDNQRQMQKGIFRLVRKITKLEKQIDVLKCPAHIVGLEIPARITGELAVRGDSFAEQLAALIAAYDLYKRRSEYLFSENKKMLSALAQALNEFDTDEKDKVRGVILANIEQIIKEYEP